MQGGTNGDDVSKEAGERERGVLLDLSGDQEAAMAWVIEEHPTAAVHVIPKADLKWRSKLSALKLVRSYRPYSVWIFTRDLETQSARRLFILFAIAAGARRIVIGDGRGSTDVIPRKRAILFEAPAFLGEFLVGYMVVTFAWLCTLLLEAVVALNRIANDGAGSAGSSVGDHQPQRHREGRGSAESALLRITSATTKNYNVLYISANPMFGAESGGMASHIAGFIAGSKALGHRVTLLTSGAAAGSRNAEPLRVADEVRSVRPSIAISPTRATFEIWNTILFTAHALRVAFRDSRAKRFDFIYQRYSRFNWTGVTLSTLTGTPLILEFNGSEVWIARHWDPVDKPRLLARVERLNLAAADSIIVVSDPLRRSLSGSGVNSAKVVVNPNGVDTDEFRPGCGGSELRRELGIDHKVVVGFTGTFGPWHGTGVLAKAACMVDEQSNCHFLFVGEGDERPAAETIIAEAAHRVSAAFVGRVSKRDVPRFLDACDILVSPHVPLADGSEFFGSPTKLFEYMAMQKPIIASRLGQIGEVIADGESGLLVEPGDAVALARAIDRLAADPELRARLGTAARIFAIEKHTWRRNAARVIETFEWHRL